LASVAVHGRLLSVAPSAPVSKSVRRPFLRRRRRIEPSRENKRARLFSFENRSKKRLYIEISLAKNLIILYGMITEAV
jgi:hypothetical protein